MLNICSLYEIFHSLICMDVGICLVIIGGWLDSMRTYELVSPVFYVLYGLYFELTDAVMLRPNSFNLAHNRLRIIVSLHFQLQLYTVC